MDYSGLMDFRRCSWIFPSYWEWNNIPTDFKSIFQRGRVGIPPTSHGFDELIHTRTEESGETWKDELGGFHWRFSVISCSRSRFWGAGILYLTTGERDLEENRGRVCEEQGCLSSTVVFCWHRKKVMLKQLKQLKTCEDGWFLIEGSVAIQNKNQLFGV